MNILHPFPRICKLQVSTSITKPNQTCFSHSTGKLYRMQFQQGGLEVTFPSTPTHPTTVTHRSTSLCFFLFWLPAPVHRPLPCPHHGLHFSDMPGPNPTQPGCYTHYLGPRHLSDHSWLEAILLLDSARSIKRRQAANLRVLKET